MLKKLLIVSAGILSICSVLIFSEVSGAASSNKTSAPKVEAGEVVKVTISPAVLRMFPGGSMQLIATAYDSNGKKIIVTPEWKIKSDIPSLGEFDKPEGQKVIFSALNSGNGSIIAVYNDIEVEVQVKVFGTKKKK